MNLLGPTFICASLIMFACSKNSTNEKSSVESGKTESKQTDDTGKEKSLNSELGSASLSCTLQFNMHLSGKIEDLQEKTRIGAAFSWNQGSPVFSSSDFLSFIALNAVLGEGNFPEDQLPNQFDFSLDPQQGNQEKMLSIYRLPGEIKFGFGEFKTCIENSSGQASQSDASCREVYKVPDDLLLKKFVLGKAIDLCGSKVDISMKISDGNLEILSAEVGPR